MALTAFVEERLELGILYGTEGGPAFRTTVVAAYNGNEQRNADWEYEGGSWVLGAHRVTRAQLDYVKTFFRARRGKAVGFRIKNYADYVLPKTPIGIGDGSTVAFQIVQVFDTGFGDAYTLPRRKIVGGTLTVYVDDVVQPSGWSADYDTGIVTFAVAPSIDAVIAVQCEYDTAVRFDVDNLRGTFMAYRAIDGQVHYEIDGIPVVEDKFA